MAILREVLVKVLGSYVRVLACVVFAVGYIWLSVFYVFDRNTEMEEHGLLAGYAVQSFQMHTKNEMFSMQKMLDHGDLKSRSTESILSTKVWNRRDLAAKYLLSEFAVWVPDSVVYPINDGRARRGYNEGRTLQESRPPLGYYFHIASSRGDAREAIAIVFESDWVEKFNIATMRMGLELMKYLTTVEWFSRDTIVIFADSSHAYAKGIPIILRC